MLLSVYNADKHSNEASRERVQIHSGTLISGNVGDDGRVCVFYGSALLPQQFFGVFRSGTRTFFLGIHLRPIVHTAA